MTGAAQQQQQQQQHHQLITSEQLSGLVQLIHTMKSKGSTEENDKEFCRLMNLLRYYQLYKDKVISTAASPPPPTALQNTSLSQSQLSNLRFQTQAYKHLQANEPVPISLQALAGIDSPENIAQRTVDAVFKADSAFKSDAKVVASRAAVDQRVIMPSVLPMTLDVEGIKRERERFLRARMEFRIAELSAIDSNLSGEEKIKALIELKSLKLFDKQRALRGEILASVSKASTLATALDRSSFKRMKKQSIREARQTEKQERQVRGEKDKRERQKHLDYVTSIMNHGREFMAFHRNNAARQQKLGSAVLRFHAQAAKEEERRMQRNSQERLNALKANDEAAYLRLLDKSKDTRITTILNQTNSFLSKLTDAVEHQKSAAGDAFMTGSKAEDDDDGEGPRDYYSTAHRITEIVTEQSSLLVGGTLKEYQVKGLQWMVSLYNNRLNGILADEMGLGKTIQTLSLITYLIEKKKQPGPFLVIVPLSTMTNWVIEFDKWAPGVTKIVYKGSPNERKNLSSLVRHGNFNVLLTTYEYIINPKDRPVLCKVKWVHMIIDEGHRMKNANSRLSVTLMTYYSSRYRLILTGTPLQNNLPELWALLNFILPKIFNSVKSFDEWFNSPFNASSLNERIELNEEEQLLIIRRLHKVLRPFLLRRLKKDVESELPDKVEVVIKCPMSALQSRMYDQIKSKKFGGDGFAKKKSLNNLVMQFRKVCNHPYVFNEIEDLLNPAHITDRNLFRVSGKFEILDRILMKLKTRDHRVLMFFQMTQIMDIMEDYLRWKGLTYLRLDGSSKADDRTVMLKAYNSTVDPPFLFLLSTRAGGLGLNLQTADTVIIFDSDWNPHADKQAEDRAHRIGQRKEVRILRLVTSQSIEEIILRRARDKLDLDAKVVQAGKFDQKTSDREREELLRNLLGGDDEDDIEKGEREGEIEDSELNEIIARNEEELEWYNQMDSERREAEEKEWRDAGNKGPVPARLIKDHELPEVLLIDVNAAEPEVVELPSGKGARSRKKVAYDDGLTEDQFLAAVDVGDLDAAIAKKEAQKQKRNEEKARRAQDHQRRRDAGEEVDSDADAFEDVPEDPLEIPDHGGEEVIGAKRTGDASPDGQAKKKKKVSKKNFAGVDPDMVDPLDPATRAQLREVLLACFKAVEDAEVDDEEEEGYTRKRSEIFLELPDRTDYADYYETIKDPIALDIILQRINSPYYSTWQECAKDFYLMFQNAMTYNEEGSFVYLDAVALQNVFNSAVQQHQLH